MVKFGLTILTAVVALITLSSAAKIKPVDALKSTERLPAICTAPQSIQTGLCVCYLNFSNSPQFSYFTSAELNAGRATCQAQFGSVSFILSQSAACNRFRQNLPSQDVNIYWLLGEANFLINTCVPDQPRLRYPGQPL